MKLSTIYHTPIPVLQELIDSQHFTELMYADAVGWLPDTWDFIETLGNIIASYSMAPPKKALQLRPKLPEKKEQRKQNQAKLGNNASKLIWRT